MTEWIITFFVQYAPSCKHILQKRHMISPLCFSSMGQSGSINIFGLSWRRFCLRKRQQVSNPGTIPCVANVLVVLSVPLNNREPVCRREVLDQLQLMFHTLWRTDFHDCDMWWLAYTTHFKYEAAVTLGHTFNGADKVWQNECDKLSQHLAYQ